VVKMCRSGVLDGQHFCFVFLVLAWLGVGGGGGCVPQQPQNYEKMSQKKNTKKHEPRLFFVTSVLITSSAQNILCLRTTFLPVEIQLLRRKRLIAHSKEQGASYTCVFVHVQFEH